MVERLEYGQTTALPRQTCNDLAVQLDQIRPSLGNHGERIVPGTYPVQRDAVPERTQPLQPGEEQLGLKRDMRRVNLQHRLARLTPCAAQRVV